MQYFWSRNLLFLVLSANIQWLDDIPQQSDPWQLSLFHKHQSSFTPGHPNSNCPNFSPKTSASFCSFFNYRYPISPIESKFCIPKLGHDCHYLSARSHSTGRGKSNHNPWIRKETKRLNYYTFRRVVMQKWEKTNRLDLKFIRWKKLGNAADRGRAGAT